MDEADTVHASYVIGKPYNGFCVAKVLNSNNSEIHKDGATVSGYLSFIKVQNVLAKDIHPIPS